MRRRSIKLNSNSDFEHHLKPFICAGCLSMAICNTNNIIRCERLYEWLQLNESSNIKEYLTILYMKLDMLKRWFYIDDVDSTIHINDKTKIVSIFWNSSKAKYEEQELLNVSTL